MTRTRGNGNTVIHPGSFVRTKLAVAAIKAHTAKQAKRAEKLQRLRMSFYRGEMTFKEAQRLTKSHELAYVIGVGSDFRKPPTETVEHLDYDAVKNGEQINPYTEEVM